MLLWGFSKSMKPIYRPSQHHKLQTLIPTTYDAHYCIDMFNFQWNRGKCSVCDPSVADSQYLLQQNSRASSPSLPFSFIADKDPSPHATHDQCISDHARRPLWIGILCASAAVFHLDMPLCQLDHSDYYMQLFLLCFGIPLKAGGHLLLVFKSPVRSGFF